MYIVKNTYFANKTLISTACYYDILVNFLRNVCVLILIHYKELLCYNILKSKSIMVFIPF